MLFPVMTQHPPFLSAVTSLNAQRRNDALYLLAREDGGTMTQYDICKTLVLADVFQMIQTGRVIFGGTLQAMQFGPVPERILDDCNAWVVALVLKALHSLPEAPPLEVDHLSGQRNHITHFRASPNYNRRDEASWDWFADDEQANIRKAFAKVRGMNWNQSQDYFHKPVSAIGYAYAQAAKNHPAGITTPVEMNWFDVLDGAEKIEGADVSHARAMLELWTEQ